MTTSLKAVPPVPLPRHEDIAPEARAAAHALGASVGRVARILTANAAMPDLKAQAKADLIAIARDALILHGML